MNTAHLNALESAQIELAAANKAVVAVTERLAQNAYSQLQQRASALRAEQASEPLDASGVPLDLAASLERETQITALERRMAVYRESYDAILAELRPLVAQLDTVHRTVDDLLAQQAKAARSLAELDEAKDDLPPNVYRALRSDLEAVASGLPTAFTREVQAREASQHERKANEARAYMASLNEYDRQRLDAAVGQEYSALATSLSREKSGVQRVSTGMLSSDRGYGAFSKIDYDRGPWWVARANRMSKFAKLAQEAAQLRKVK